MPRITVETEVYLEDEIVRLGKKDLLELRREIDKRLSGKHPTLFGGESAHESLPPADSERVHSALRHLRMGNSKDALWELESAFDQPVSPLFRARRFAKDAA
jgi:hypothetical protein